MKVIAALCVLTLTTSAFAHPPPGTDLHSAEHLWWECQTQPQSQVICCSEADGHNLDDSHWRINKDKGLYQVLVDGAWFDVPRDRVINETSKCGPEPNIEHREDAKVWYAPSRNADGAVDSLIIYCFEPGTFY